MIWVASEKELSKSSRDNRKYKNEKVECDGLTFDSVRERDRYLDLKLMERAGLIYGLRTQVPFLLIPKQEGEKACSYIADFVYSKKSGERVVEDAKGVKTPEYRIKRKLMLYVHGIRISEV